MPDPRTLFFLGLMGLPPDTPLPGMVTTSSEESKEGEGEGESDVDAGEWVNDWSKLVNLGVQLSRWVSWGEWSPRLYGPQSAKEVYDKMVPAGKPVRTPTIPISPEAPILPPPTGEEGTPILPMDLTWNGLERLAEMVSILAFLFGAQGCIACPFKEGTIKLPLPPRFYLWHLARVNTPVGCSPLSFWMESMYYSKDLEERYAIIKFYLNLPLPVGLIARAVGSLASLLFKIAEAGYELLSEICEDLAEDYFSRYVGTCMAAIFIDIHLQKILIISCMKKATQQLKKGIELAENAGNHAPSTHAVHIPL